MDEALKAMDREFEAFKQREQERAELRAVLDPILSSIQAAEEKMTRLGICDARDWRHLAQARIDVLHILANAQEAATTQSERLYRAGLNASIE